ncbi:hypothetical protein EMIHUDRAFT_109501 [Emiliania huxleyi CCMP1516]|uniref:Major facilitator superfamily (MFS) profile domain-containing protein n=2 Tax=Emiliania huxleyi TaxID=2903 RepID=A0A0D3KQ63_EMIH1|nr:hypothetical protein EMIHUDRAFT_109501 [Emiliania huxleyi CCMP1516]EOD37898.1 hypothetical protein EMIHUDRAFT_109501 [Emiliania huxleyi CCMP1516]|eukprot:XP_005790327.1 hypothetical protein EMIHUDRAFT_109501 [Emiliania huxleyi CCMP1516]
MLLRCVGLALLFAGPAAAYQPACDGRLPLLRRAPLVASSSAVAAPQSRASDRQLYLLFGSRFVQSIMRLAMGPLVVYVCGDMACDASSRGQLLSSYSLGYLSSQIAGGALADRIGPRLVILCASALGGACTLASASARSVRALCLAQVLLGVSQGPLYPTSIAYLGPALPPSKRAHASTVLDLGITLATLLALPFSGAIAAAVGWRARTLRIPPPPLPSPPPPRGAFRLYGVLGLAFTALWASLSLDLPSQHPPPTPAPAAPAAPAATPAATPTAAAAAVSSAASAIAAAREARVGGGVGGEGGRGGRGVPPLLLGSRRVRLLLSSGAVWVIFFSHMAFNLCIYFMTSWAPTFYSESFGLLPEKAELEGRDEAKLALALPPLVDLAVKALLARPLEAALRGPGVGFVGSALAMLATPAAASRFGAVGATCCFSLANGFAALHPSGFKASYMDVTRSATGVVTGVGNTLASLAAFVGPVVVGLLLQRLGSWAPSFCAIATLQLLAALAFARFSTATPVDEEKPSADLAR